MMSGDRVVIPIHWPGRLEISFFFAQGMIMSIPMAIYFEQFFVIQLVGIAPWMPMPTVLPLIVAPLIEEFAKVFPLFERHGETVRSIVFLGFVTGIGFGFAEFLIYVLQYGAPFEARLLQVLIHGSNSLIASYGIAVKRFLTFYIIAIGLHASFNLLVDRSDILVVGANIAAGAAILLAFGIYRKAEDRIIA